MNIRERVAEDYRSVPWPDTSVRLRDAEALVLVSIRLLAALKDLRAMIIGEHGASAYENINGERADSAIAYAEDQL